MNIQVAVDQGSSKTGGWLLELLGDREVTVVNRGGDASVCYGIGLDARPSLPKPALNANCSKFNKLQQLQKLQEAGIRVPRFVPARQLGAIRVAAGFFQANVNGLKLLGRRLAHHDGNDLAVIENIERAPEAEYDFFTAFIPQAAEYRTWVWRGRVLGTYLKVAKDAASKAKLARTFRNGWEMKWMDTQSVNLAIHQASIAPVKALGLHFGGVDILQSQDGNFYVLEVNTAPGANGIKSTALNNLADKIAEWVEDGCPMSQ